MGIVGKLAKSVREFKLHAILSPIEIAGESLLEVAIPAVMATLIDDGIQGGNMNTVWQTALILIGLAFLSLGCASVASIAAAKASAGFAKNLRKDLYYNGSSASASADSQDPRTASRSDSFWDRPWRNSPGPW